jgi:monofunctional biosynthetic peptidoglycan transglycosylase
MLFEFDQAEISAEWDPVNDTVMGGVSFGEAGLSPEGLLIFTGRVSLENNGGFASIRSRSGEYDLSAYSGLLIRFKGDGRRYSLNLRTSFRIPAGSYRMKLTTRQDSWQELYFPFADFRPVSFGREVSGVPAIDLGKIRSFGFMISDGQEGPFRLEVDWIRAVSGNPQSNQTRE